MVYTAEQLKNATLMQLVDWGFDHYQMGEIIKGLESGVDVSTYADSKCRITNNTRKGGNTMLLTIIKILGTIFSVSGIVYLLTDAIEIEMKDGIVEDGIISRISSISAVCSLMSGTLTLICCLVYLILY